MIASKVADGSLAGFHFDPKLRYKSDKAKAANFKLPRAVHT